MQLYQIQYIPYLQFSILSSLIKTNCIYSILSIRGMYIKIEVILVFYITSLLKQTNQT